MFTRIVALVLTSSSFAIATPSVGDSSVFAYTTRSGGNFAQGTFEMSLISQSGDSFQRLQTSHMENSPTESYEETIVASDLLDDQTIAELLANCTELGGQPEQLTVPAGIFETCMMMENQNSRTWVGAVPMGIIKQVTLAQTGVLITMELMSFKYGQTEVCP